jgi:hypothetical protein
MRATVDHPARTSRPRRTGLKLLLFLVVLPVCLFAAWTWITLHFSYSKGERAGYVQKISKKGWLCKTWEGELAVSTFPGSVPQIFAFSVRNDSVAEQVQRAAGQRVRINVRTAQRCARKVFRRDRIFRH